MMMIVTMISKGNPSEKEVHQFYLVIIMLLSISFFFFPRILFNCQNDEQFIARTKNRQEEEEQQGHY